MASQGMVCDNMFSSHPLCSPFRAILLTGRYAWRNGVIDNEYEPFRNIPTLPGALRSEGYHTGHIGIWHLGVAPYPERDRYGLDYLAAVEGIGGNYYDQSYCENERAPKRHEGWSPAIETDLAIRFMSKHKAERKGDPFALFVSWRPPHWPYPQYPAQYRLYDPADVDLPGNVPLQMAEFASREIADYHGCCTGLDAEMGRLLNALEELGLADDTIVCYSSDHGDHLSSHGYGKPYDSWMHRSMRASKATPYEESAHVPFLIRWHGVTAPGSRSSVFMGSIDLVPGLLGACGVNQPDGLQGRDISPLWRGEPACAEAENTPGANDSVYLMNLANGWPNRSSWVGRWRGVRTERYTYARWFDHERGPWLFDRHDDPLEMRNVAGTFESRSAVEELGARLHGWMEATGDPFEFGKRGPRGFLDVGQRWADPERWKDRGTT
jgi:arylsulfatase A-like enzyme